MSSTGFVDPQAVELAQEQIRGVVAGITRIAQQDLPPDEFFAQFLTRVVTGLAATGGAVWAPDENGQPQLQCQENLRQTGLTASDDHLVAHRRLVQQVLDGQHGDGRQSEGGQSEGLLVAPRYRDQHSQAANPTDCLLVLAPVRVAERTEAVVEIFQRPDSSPAARQGHLRFVQQMCHLAADYFKNRQLRDLAQRATLWHKLDQFTRAVHASLDPTDVAYVTANEGRNLIECDRLSVATCRGKKCTVAAISGQDTLDPRAHSVRLLGQLAATVVAGGEAVWFSGDGGHLSPQIEAAFQQYVDETHCKYVSVVPLVPAGQSTDSRKPPPRPLGALLVEQIEDTSPRLGLAERVQFVAEHSAAALANAQKHEHLFLMPLWRALGKSRWLWQAGTWPKTVAVLTVAVLLLAAAVLVPYDFDMHARGTLQPVFRRNVFAGIDGTVQRLAVRHGQPVRQGQLLAELRNTDLEVAMTDVGGQHTATQQQLLSVERALFDRRQRLTPEEHNRLAGQRSELHQRLASLAEQLKLYHHKQNLLKVNSPIQGEITTWNVEERLLHRPVQQGQVLLGVADTSGQWELELRVPEDRMGYLAAARQQSAEPLRVTYRLATDPGVDHQGTVKEVHLAAEVRGEEGNTVLVKVAIDKQGLKHLRPGADVSAKVHCGRRRLAYVWLHDAIAFVQTRILFKL